MKHCFYHFPTCVVNLGDGLAHAAQCKYSNAHVFNYVLLNYFGFYVWVFCLHLYRCTCVSSTHGGKKRASNCGWQLQLQFQRTWCLLLHSKGSCKQGVHIKITQAHTRKDKKCFLIKETLVLSLCSWIKYERLKLNITNQILL